MKIGIGKYKFLKGGVFWIGVLIYRLALIPGFLVQDIFGYRIYIGAYKIVINCLCLGRSQQHLAIIPGAHVGYKNVNIQQGA